MKTLVEKSIAGITPPALTPHVLRFVLIGLPILVVYYTLVVLAVLSLIRGSMLTFVEVFQQTPPPHAP